MRAGAWDILKIRYRLLRDPAIDWRNSRQNPPKPQFDDFIFFSHDAPLGGVNDPRRNTRRAPARGNPPLMKIVAFDVSPPRHRSLVATGVGGVDVCLRNVVHSGGWKDGGHPHMLLASRASVDSRSTKLCVYRTHAHSKYASGYLPKGCREMGGWSG